MRSTFKDTHRCRCRDDPDQVEAGVMKNLPILVRGPFETAKHDEHVDVEELGL